MPLRNGFLITAAVGLACVGCASQADRPTAEITRARTLIEQAEKAGAQQYAAVELDQARNKLRLAEADAGRGKHDEARARANEAASDAELAQAKATSGEAEKAAEEVEKSTETLQRETQREEGAAVPDATTPPPQPQQ